MAFSQGLVDGTDIPVGHLDYDYIGKCERASEVESLLKILLSNQEGHYPDLIKFTEERLQKLNPKSKLLIKRKDAQKLRDLSSSDSHGIMEDLDQWEQQMNRQEADIQDTPPNDPETVVNGEDHELPPIRKAGPITKDVSSKGKSGGDGSGERLLSNDYQGWDKYNVEDECTKLEKETSAKEAHGKSLAMEACLSEKELKMSAVEKNKLALAEKEKGNEAFRAGDYEEALAYYSRSILLCHSAPSYNNRAITFIKLQRYQEAIQDCASVLQLEPTNTKALLRRGTALLGVKDWAGAKKAMQQLLELEPKSKKAQEVLSDALEQIAKSAKPEPKKGRRVQIEEVDEEEATIPPTPPPPGPVTSSAGPVTSSAAAPMPHDVAEWKEKGNEMFRKGQYGEAGSFYTKAVKRLEGAGEEHTISLSTLLNNRAACHLKNGNSQACVTDCTHSLQLSPINIKALVRRAQAYEHMEKYRLAYIDNQLALSLDRGMDTVYVTNNRIRQQLVQQDGSQWREKLPPHPDQNRLAQALSQLTMAGDTAQPVYVAAPTATPTTQPSMTATPTSQHSTPATPTTPPPKASTTHSVTTSSASNVQTKVTQATTPISTSTTTNPHPAVPEPTDTDRFEKAKARGNEHVKKGQYLEGLNCYSLCIEACPDRVVGYTNRALCHLKLNSPVHAERDCSKGLELEPNNIKALYRRALARKAMARYADSMKDLKQLLELDNENSVARGEYATVKQLWEKQLRQLQDKSQKQKGKKSNKKKSSPGQKHKGATKERGRDMQQQELEQLLAETKNKMKELEKEVRDPLTFAENSSEYLNASKTTYYTAPATAQQKATAASGGTRRRKVVVEEERGEEQPPVLTTEEKAPEGGDGRGGDQPPTTVEGATEEGGAPATEKKEERSDQDYQPLEEVGGGANQSLEKDTGEEGSGKDLEASTIKLSSPFEFVRRWNSISRGASTAEYAALLQQIPPKKLPEIITNKLEGAMLSKIIAAISEKFLPQKHCQLSLEILENLSKVPRFQMIAMFLEKQEKAELSRALDVLEKWDGCSELTIGNLRKLYGVNT